MLGGIAPAIIGGRGFVLRVRIEPSEIASLDFEHFGLPKTARVVGVNYTPSGKIMPVELHGNEPRRNFPRVVELYGRPVGEGPHQTTEVHIAVTWIPTDAMEGNYAESLCAAFEAYSNGRYQDVIVPANVTVEVVLEKLMADFFSAGVSRQRVDDFLSDGATYSYQLNAILPALTRRLGISPLPDEIRGQLNRLRGLRNQLAHRGMLDVPLNRSDAAACLLASFFGVHYIHFARPRLLGQESAE
jgi:hypothetical protein